MLSLTVLLFTLVGHGLAVLVNYTIDDKPGNYGPIYSPTKKWWGNKICGIHDECWSDPNIKGTWHGTTVDSDRNEKRFMNITFPGYAIYVFFITPPHHSDIYPQIDVTIYLDGERAGRYTNKTNPAGQSHYHRRVDQPSSLSGSFTPSSSSSATTSSSAMTPPFLTPPFPPGPSSSTVTPNSLITSKSLVAIVVGGIVGGFTIISSILLVFFCRHRGSHCLAPDMRCRNTCHMSLRGRCCLQSESPGAYRSTFDPDIVPPIPVWLWPENQEQRHTTHAYTSTPSTSRLPNTGTKTFQNVAATPNADAGLRPVELELEGAELMRSVTAIHYP